MVQSPILDIGEELTTTSHVARALGIAENTVRELVARGELPCARIGRWRVFRTVDVERLREIRAMGQGR